MFSFHPVKIITTAEGGMAMTNNEALAERMALLRSHGVTRDPKRITHEPDGPWYYQQVDLGFNYRMTDLQAALGLSQLRRVDEYVCRRHQLAARYDRLLAGLPVVLPHRAEESHSAFHLYVICLRQDETAPSRGDVFRTLRTAGIGVQVHYIPVHAQPYYRRLGFRPGSFPEAERYYAHAISLPLYPTMTEAQQDHVVEIVRQAFGSSTIVQPMRAPNSLIQRGSASAT